MSRLSRVDATRRAQRVRDGVLAIDDVLDTLVEIQECQDWMALGYKSWSEYYEGEFGAAKLKLNAEQRGRVVAVLAAAGMSRRKVAKALGVSEGTVRNDLKGAQNYALSADKPQVNETAAVTPTFEEGPDVTPEHLDEDGVLVYACEKCGGEVERDQRATGYARCEPCDPDGDHYRHELVDGGRGPCETCNPEDSVPAISYAGTAPAGQPLASDVPEVVPSVAADGRPGMNVDADGENASLPSEPPAGAGGDGDAAGEHADPSGVESGVAAPDSGVEGVAVAGSPSTDPASTFMGDWRRFVRLAVGADTEVVGPMLTEAEFSELYGDLELLREQVKKLQRHA